MAFWGVEVKPGTPFTHAASAGKRRLHISQATLGTGSGATKSVVQCNVGKSSPVFLCSLFPEKSESCQLNLEYDEVNDVMLSVLGPRSVHLAGYFLTRCLNDESESYGEDIRNSESERSNHTDDEYEDSFIDDGDSEDGSEEIEEEVVPKKLKHKRLRKLRELVNENEVSKSEDADFLLLSTSNGSKDASIEKQSRVEQKAENKIAKEGDLERNKESVINCEDGVKLNKKHNKPNQKGKESEADKLNSETLPDKSSQLPNEEDTSNGEANQEPTKVSHVKRKKIKEPRVKEETNANDQDVVSLKKAEGVVDDEGTKRKKKRKEKASETDNTLNNPKEIKDEQIHTANRAEHAGDKNCSEEKKRKKKRNKTHESGVESILGKQTQ